MTKKPTSEVLGKVRKLALKAGTGKITKTVKSNVNFLLSQIVDICDEALLDTVQAGEEVCKRCNGSGHVPVEQFIFACPECKEQPKPEIVTVEEAYKKWMDKILYAIPQEQRYNLESPAACQMRSFLSVFPNGLIVRGEK